MERVSLRRIALATVCGAFIGIAAAQQPAQQPDKAAPAPKAPAATAAPAADAPIAGKTTLGVTVAEAAIIAKGFRASKLLKADVYNDNNQKIGKIDDFIVSPDGTVTTAVIDVGGFLGLAAHRVAIPIRQLGQLAPKIVLPGATKDALKALPEFKYLA
jgi:sporulation protein YlmC with PRC-barrel domain